MKKEDTSVWYKFMILTSSAFLNSFLCNYNLHGKDLNSTAKK